MNDQSKQKDEFDIDAAFEDAFLSDTDDSLSSDTKNLDTDFFLDDDSTSYAALTGQTPATPAFDTDTTPSQEPVGNLEPTEPAVPPTSPVIDPPTPVVPAGKKSFFNKKPKTAKPIKPFPVSKPTKTKAGDPNKLNMMILGAVVALVLLIAAFVLFKGGDVPEPVAPVVAPAVVEDTTTSDTATEQPIIADETPVQPITESDNQPVDIIDVGAIVTAEIPQDPALIKEEIDRLSDKEQRLAEQAKLIDEQLVMMDELTSAKEEQIALLEAQIAQLEAQNN